MRTHPMPWPSRRAFGVASCLPLPRRAASVAVYLPLLLAACELEEVSVVDVEDVVVAEVYVNVKEIPTENQVLGLLHKTVGPTDPGDVRTELVGSRLTVRRSDGTPIPVQGADPELCLEEEPQSRGVACFLADVDDASGIRPGELLELDVELPDGGRLEGATRVPGGFELLGVPQRCTLAPDTLLPLRWSRADGAWAYVNETAISGLPGALEPEGIDVEEDPLYLLGLSISDSDTTIVFPSEFGVFNRFELEQDLAVRLQRGLPVSTRAEVTVTAVDRNYVNWARGGSFNPSGQVRIPSLRGDGTGVFAATVGRRMVLDVASEPLPGIPLCLSDGG
ncbi:MAG: hypothetical protein R3304_00625 [Longimicrobiales bacterium]|nr:hypothetical protein [Longimicrobiales bacterium]